MPRLAGATTAAGLWPAALAFGAGLLCPALLALAAVLAGNHGAFAYPLDGPYIHLALAGRILQGHAG